MKAKNITNSKVLENINSPFACLLKEREELSDSCQKQLNQLGDMKQQELCKVQPKVSLWEIQ